jgi:hypothetical protein
MHSTRQLHFAALFVLAVAALSGCKKHEDSLAPVHGKVYFHNEPLRSGTIVFTPDTDRGGGGPMARAEIKADGTYVLTTGPENGCVPGWHRITIMAGDPSSLGVPLALPRKYTDPTMSGLSQEVKGGEDNTVDLYLN